MLSRPFRPPLLKHLPHASSKKADDQCDEPPAKRRRISEEGFDEESSDATLDLALPKCKPISKSAFGPRKPLVVVKNPPDLAGTEKSQEEGGAEGWYNVLWRKYTAKKHKTWDGDGVLAVHSGYAHLQDVSGQDMGRVMLNSTLLPGSILSIAGKDVEVDSVITKEDLLAGRPFLKTGRPSTSVKADDRPANPPATKLPSLKPLAITKAQILQGKEDAKKTLNGAAPKSLATRHAFKNPLKDSTILVQKRGVEPVPRHDPNQPGALVMKRPEKPPKDKQIVDVVLDPLVGRHLREHQREGVKFLYECVMGLREFNGEGAILADEMGLGKTLQTIAILWTLLKQNPIYDQPPVIKKALVVCPVTLINNWQKEFRKWLGNERIGVFVADGKKTRLTDFTMGKSYSVMIIGYERLRAVQEELTKGSGIDIVIADEGHRLKTVQNKCAQAIQSLNTERRIILSGTPIQNDLSEFHAMVDFVNPGIVGTYKEFMKIFEGPIVKSRQPNATQKDIEKGEGRSEELASRTSPFILRRTADILSKYLPPKTEYVLFCIPTPTQANIYRHVLGSPVFQSALGNSECALQLITILKKLCNSPSLISPKTSDDSANSTITALLSTLPISLQHQLTPSTSTKLRVLDQLLINLRTTSSEKVVLVSNYTSTLTLLANLFTSLSLPFLRLDGSTPAAKRGAMVEDFNRSTADSCFAFLLSAKAGGTGLNLIGASRLVLFDVDWNPATDMQAMARIHRDGQKRHCKIYRLIVKGGLEERIWQRQVTKIGLVDSVMEKKGGSAQFSQEVLRDLFRLDEAPGCRTHELLGCDCGGKGRLGSSVVEEKVTKTESDGWYQIPDTDDDEEDQGDKSAPLVVDLQEDDSLPDIPALIKASNLDIEDQERRIQAGIHPKQANGRDRKQKYSKMQSLMHYEHIDTSRLAESGPSTLSLDNDDIRDLIDDDALWSVLEEEGNGVGFVFKKTSSSGSVAEAVALAPEKSRFF